MYITVGLILVAMYFIWQYAHCTDDVYVVHPADLLIAALLFFIGPAISFIVIVVLFIFGVANVLANVLANGITKFEKFEIRISKK